MNILPGTFGCEQEDEILERGTAYLEQANRKQDLVGRCCIDHQV